MYAKLNINNEHKLNILIINSYLIIMYFEHKNYKQGIHFLFPILSAYITFLVLTKIGKSTFIINC